MSGPDIGDAEIASVTHTLRSGCLSIGPRLERFERQVAAIAGAKHAVGVSSGTAGLHLAVIDAGVDAGDFVITSPFSFVASANCVLYERAIPVFVDVDPRTANIDPALVTQAIHDLRTWGAARRRWLPRAVREATAHFGRLKAVLPVHAFGQPADMDPIVAAARSYGVTVVEDACEAIGAGYKGRPTGVLGDTGVFAFYPNKQVTTGEGGMIVTNRDDSAALFRSLRNQGRDAMSAWLTHDRLGYNYRLSELGAALGSAQIGRLDELLGRRDRVSRWYSQRLSAQPGVATPTVGPTVSRMSWFVYVVRLDASLDRRALMQDLSEQGIPSRPYFSPIHLQSFYVSRFGYMRGDFPHAEALAETCLALPFSGAMTERQVDRVCAALASAIAVQHRQGPAARRVTAREAIHAEA
jgi:dTDP-4-amino-4,6-dideoxygalactose transaminase